MSIEELRQILSQPNLLAENAFSALQAIARLIADPDQEHVGHEMVLRVLEHRGLFGAEQELLDSLARAVGLFPYVDTENLGYRDAIAYEFHRPPNMGGDFVFHREQAEIYRRLMGGDSVILSAPTSFGKSKIVDAILAAEKFRNVVVVVPTLALIDETRRRLAQFGDRYKVITHTSQRLAERNVFVFTAERTVAYADFPVIDFFVIDEFYKLGAMAVDATRTVALNQAFYKLLRFRAQFYLLGPSIQHVPDGLESALRCVFYPTRYATVVSETHMVTGKGSDIERLVRLCSGLDEATLIFCKSPARVNEVARALLEAVSDASAPELASAAAWAASNYHADWVFGSALTRGIGIHHGKLPRSLAQYVVRMFNEGRLKFLICTSTLIEGVNTKAKNVVVFDNKIAQRQIDFFTFNNIRGRSGRMFEHFVGRVYLFNAPPEEELPLVDFPILTQPENTPDTLLLQMDNEDLSPRSRQRMNEFHDQTILPVEVLRENESIPPGAQIGLARRLLEAPEAWSILLNWNPYPTSKQRLAICELIWDFFVERGHGGVVSSSQLAYKMGQMMQQHTVAQRVQMELVPGRYAARSADEAVERVLEFERTWASFELPRFLTAVSRIQRAVLQPRRLAFGDYTILAAKFENLFTNPVAAALDEYGVPLQLATPLTEYLGETEDLDAALAKMKQLNLDNLHLGDFQRELLGDAIAQLP